MEKALLIVSFGTSCPEVLERDIVPVERAIRRWILSAVGSWRRAWAG